MVHSREREKYRTSLLEAIAEALDAEMPEPPGAAQETDDEPDHPTNEDGEPLCTGKDDGQCSRVVDEPGGVCWQHAD